MDGIWIVRMTIAPYTDRNNIRELWFKINSSSQMTAAVIALQRVQHMHPDNRLYSLHVTVDHEPYHEKQGILEWGEGK